MDDLGLWLPGELHIGIFHTGAQSLAIDVADFVHTKCDIFDHPLFLGKVDHPLFVGKEGCERSLLPCKLDVCSKWQV